MATFTFRAAVLPSNFKGGPQELFDAIVDRLEVVGDSPSFVEGDTMPSSNQGPWLKGSKQWWVWDEDTSTYVPQDISASTSTQEIFVGEEPPDTTVLNFPRIWLKTLGITVVGLYYFFNDSTGWVTTPLELQANSITNAMLQDNCISTRNLQDGCVTNDQLPSNLPFSKFQKGTKNQFLRMDANGVTPIWRTFVVESQATAFTSSNHQIITIPHGVTVEDGTVPNFFRVVLRCLADEHGFTANEEVDITGSGCFQIDQVGALYKIDSQNIVIWIRHGFIFFSPSTWAMFAPTPAKWRIVCYTGVG